MKPENKYLFIIVPFLVLLALILVGPLLIKDIDENSAKNRIIENSESVLIDDLSKGEGTIVNGKFSTNDKDISESEMKEVEKSIAQESEEIDNLLKHSVIDTNDIPVNSHQPISYSDNNLMSIPEDIEEKDLVEVGDTTLNVSADVEIIDIPDIFLGE